MNTILDNKRAFYIRELGLTAQQGARMSINDLEVAFFSNPKEVVNQGDVISLLNSTNDRLLRVEVTDDGSPTAGWPDRLVFFYLDPIDGAIRTGYFNEYGEVRSRSAKLNTVALRALAHPNNVNTPIFQVTNDTQGAVYLSVSKLGVSGPNIPVDKVRTTDAAAINNSTTLVTDGTMQFAVAAAATYIIEGILIYDCAAAADLKMRFNYSGTGTGEFATPVLTTAATSSATNQGNFAARDINSNFACGGYGVGTGSLAALAYRGTLIATAAGTFSIQYAQNTADVSDLIVRAGSHLSYRQAA
jgi:hypothetical protein